MNATGTRQGFRQAAAIRSIPVSPDLAGITEIAALLDKSPRTVRNYVRRPDFPAPVEELATGRVWRRADIEKWARAHLPLRTGRPPKP